MTEQSTPENAVQAGTTGVTAGGEPTAAPPRRRRASRPAAAPEAVVTDAVATDAVAADQPPASPESQADASPEAAPEAAKAPAKRRRATRSKAAPEVEAAAPAAEVEGAASEPLADEAAPAVPTEAVAPAAAEKPARRRRASSRPAAAPTADDEQAAPQGAVAEPAAPAADVPAVEAVEAATETPAPARRRSRRVTTAPAVEQPAPEPAVEDVPQEAAPAPAAEPVAQPAAPAPSAGSPRLATTALLFQAPDPTQARQRRRRVTSSAGSPEEISQAARLAQEAEQAAALQAAAEVGEDELDEAALAEAEAAAPAAEPDEPAEGTDARGGRRRSRRGRGGRGRGASADRDEDAEESDDAAQAQGADDVVVPAEADETTDSDEATDTDDESDAGDDQPRRRRRRGGRGRRKNDTDRDDETTDADAGEPAAQDAPDDADDESGEGSSRRRRRRRRGARTGEAESEPRRRGGDEVTALRGSTRLEAKRQRRREGRDAGRRRQIITESEFLARRESVDRSMIVREKAGRTQIAVLEDGVLVEHYVSNQQQASMVGNVYLGRVQNVLPSMEAAFVDVGKGRNAVLYAGEVNWDAAGLDGQPRRIEQALKSGDAVLVQVTKDPIGHKGARLTSQVTLAGRYLVYVPGGGMTGISRKLPDTERNRLKKILREVVPDSAGVIVRTAAEGASEDELRADIARLQGQWEAIEKKAKTASAPALLQGEPDMAIRVVRDIFNDDFGALQVQGDEAWSTISSYIDELAPDLAQKVSKYTGTGDVFAAHRIDEQLVKGMDRKVWLPSGGSLVIDRTEAMTVVDVNTGKFTGSGGTLEETVTRNNLEAAEEIVRQLRLRDIGGMIVIDFIDMVLESNRDLVLRRLVECLGRDRTKHQVAEVTSLGLVQMTRKRVGQGLVEAFSETCEHCHGRGFIVHDEPIEKGGRPEAAPAPAAAADEPKRARRKRGAKEPAAPAAHPVVPVLPEERSAVKATLATIAAAAAHAHELHDQHASEAPETDAQAPEPAPSPVADAPVDEPVVAAPVDVPAGTEPVVAEPVAEAPVLDVFAEFAGRRPGSDEPDQLELTPVDPSVFVTFDSDDDETSV